MIIVAIGQDIESEPFEARASRATGADSSPSRGRSPSPGFEGVFCGGDCHTGPATVIRAINAGKVAARNIDHYLGFDHEVGVDIELPAARSSEARTSAAAASSSEREAVRAHGGLRPR